MAALGALFLDAAGNVSLPIGRSLGLIYEIDLDGLVDCSSVKIIMLCDIHRLANIRE